MALAGVFSAVLAQAAVVVPAEVQMPGTQPGEVSNLQSPSKCDNCHGGYQPTVEPAYQWRGGMMAHAARDPIFWATMAIAEQDFDGAGDFCLRCHVGDGWLAGRSTPTDGSGLSTTADTDGVQCDLCHRLTNPDGSEHVGEQFAPFIANDGGSPPLGHYGSGQYVVWDESSKLGPYVDADATHQFVQSFFHRSSALCGTCHDVSNPVTGDLAPNNGAQLPLAPGTFNGQLGGAVETKAAFNNFPYQFGTVERTYSEHVASAFPSTRVSSYPLLPADLRQGAIQDAYEAALAAGNGGDYSDGTPRFFTCQSCHMRPTAGQGCNKNPPIRSDLPVHDLTGGNFWIPDAIAYLDSQDELLLGGGLSAGQLDALEDGAQRARINLTRAAALSIVGDAVRVVNLTGHKLISGYPEGRRMWLRARWYDPGGALVREDGAYGSLTVQIDGQSVQVDTILDLTGTNTKIYEAHGAITQAWAAKLIQLGTSPSLPVAFDRVTGAVSTTLGDVAAQAPGTHRETFHFALNNHVARDNRIPPYEMAYDEARIRNALPVPESQYGNPGSGGVYQYWDDVALNPPAGATYASVELLYQPTSWEYVQFLYLANSGTSPHLGDEGQDILEAWLATGMADPVVMASVTYGAPPSTTTTSSTSSTTASTTSTTTSTTSSTQTSTTTTSTTSTTSTTTTSTTSTTTTSIPPTTTTSSTSSTTASTTSTTTSTTSSIQTSTTTTSSSSSTTASTTSTTTSTTSSTQTSTTTTSSTSTTTTSTSSTTTSIPPTTTTSSTSSTTASTTSTTTSTTSTTQTSIPTTTSTSSTSSTTASTTSTTTSTTSSTQTSTTSTSSTTSSIPVTTATTSTTTTSSSTTLPPDDQLLSGKKLLLRNRSEKVQKRRLLILSRDVSITLGRGPDSEDDPTLHGGSLRIRSSASEGIDVEYDLNSSNWSSLKEKDLDRGWKYTKGDPIKKVLVRRGKRIKIIGRGVGLDHDLATDPIAVDVVLTLGSQRYCLQFGGTTTFTPNRKFFAKDAVAPERCSVTGSPPATSLRRAATPTGVEPANGRF